MREFVTLPNAVTSGNLTAGFLALLVIRTDLLLAAALVTFAAVFDSLDGMVAHRNPTRDPFGANLDSLADLVSFGVVPALALYEGSLHTLSVPGLVVCLGYLLCGAWRLARFPLANDRDNFVGLPIPPAGLLVAWLVAFGTPRVLLLLVALLLAGLMVSEMPFPKLSALRHPGRLFNK